MKFPPYSPANHVPVFPQFEYKRQRLKAIYCLIRDYVFFYKCSSRYGKIVLPRKYTYT